MAQATATATDVSRVDALLAYVRAHRITHVSLYGLERALHDTGAIVRLKTFVASLRAAGVREVWVPVGGPRRMDVLERVVAAHPDLLFDGLVTEFEYWNRCDQPRTPPPTTPAEARTACFAPMRALVERMRAFADARSPKWKVGAYLGTPTESEAAWLATHVDFVALDFPGRTPDGAVGGDTERAVSRRTRVEWFTRAGVDVWPILYARGEVPLDRPQLADGPFVLETRFVQAFRARTHTDPPFAGVLWFADDALVPGVRP